ncbi:hypothetical protein F5B20DRAFT_554940 [Whalleya microplaca]|nr:hypothetical protein F5B20DRAFT_554940 [Whalleya microplaca]
MQIFLCIGCIVLHCIGLGIVHCRSWYKALWYIKCTEACTCSKRGRQILKLAHEALVRLVVEGLLPQENAANGKSTQAVQGRR